MSNDYYLYDAASKTLISIWRASTTTAGVKSPDASPSISIKVIEQGYRFAWAGLFPADDGFTPISINNVYKRERDSNGGVRFVCYDFTDPRSASRGGEMCHNDVIDRVDNQSNLNIRKYSIVEAKLFE